MKKSYHDYKDLNQENRESNKINQSVMNIEDENIKFKFADLLHEILQKNILLKLNKHATLIVPGKIIRFSELIKKQCCSSNFDCKITLETVERPVLEMILEFFQILDWRLEEFFLELKSEELKNWTETYKPFIKQIESTSRFLGINQVLMYLNELEEFNKSKEHKLIKN
jgi:hypothetical protein